MPWGRASKIAQWLKSPVAKPEDLSLIPRTHMVEEGTNSWNLSSDFQYLHAPPHTQFF